MKTHERDRLIVALSTHEIVESINALMLQSKLELRLDYQDKYSPALMARAGNGPYMRIMDANPTAHTYRSLFISDFNLSMAIIAIREVIRDNNGHLVLTCSKDKRGVKRVALQIHVDGAKTIAMTLMEATRGNYKSDTGFELPGKTQ